MALLDYWAQYPSASAVRRIQYQRETNWRPPTVHDEANEGQSSTVDDMREFAANVGVTVGGLSDMPPHLLACLQAARTAIKTGKVN